MILIQAARKKFSDEEIIRIYENEYIKEHIGGYSLGKKYGVDFYKDFNRLNLEMRNDQEKSRKYYCDSDYFDVIDTEEKAYWLGFCYCDGYITHSSDSFTMKFGLSLNNADLEHMQKFKNAINADAPINTYTVYQGYKVGAEYCRILIHDDVFANHLITHGCVERKSNIMKPPSGVPLCIVKHFIRGVMDVNGSIVITNGESICPSFQIVFTGTDSFLMWIQQYLLDNNAISRIYPLSKRKEGQIVSSFSFGGNYQVKHFLDFIYEEATIYLDRKYERYLKLCKILSDREANKPIYKCSYCGSEDSSEYYVWHHDGEYQNKVLCGKHYQQLRKYGKIIKDKNNQCDVCGCQDCNLYQLGRKWGDDWWGKTVCDKHYYQLSYQGTITDPSAGRHKYVKSAKTL